jgi:hypothetical protein
MEIMSIEATGIQNCQQARKQRLSQGHEDQHRGGEQAEGLGDCVVSCV